jgi:hypothetical protein
MRCNDHPLLTKRMPPLFPFIYGVHSNYTGILNPLLVRAIDPNVNC